MNLISYYESDDSLTIYVNGEAYPVHNSHKNINKIRECLASGDQNALQDALDLRKAITSYTYGKVTVNNGTVLYNGEVCECTTLVEEILRLMEEGLEFEKSVAFLNNLMENPSMKSRAATHEFIQKGNLPITPDGYFLGYRSVTHDWKDWHTKTVDNSVGAKPYMDRAKCDDNSGVACSKGFHVGTLNYVQGFHWKENGGHVIIVKVNPKDIVSVPSDAQEQKLRCNTYEVVGEYTGPLPTTYCEEYNNDCCGCSEESCDSECE